MTETTPLSLEDTLLTTGAASGLAWLAGSNPYVVGAVVLGGAVLGHLLHRPDRKLVGNARQDPITTEFDDDPAARFPLGAWIRDGGTFLAGFHKTSPDGKVVADRIDLVIGLAEGPLAAPANREGWTPEDTNDKRLRRYPLVNGKVDATNCLDIWINGERITLLKVDQTIRNIQHRNTISSTWYEPNPESVHAGCLRVYWNNRADGTQGGELREYLQEKPSWWKNSDFGDYNESAFYKGWTANHRLDGISWAHVVMNYKDNGLGTEVYIARPIEPQGSDYDRANFFKRPDGVKPDGLTGLPSLSFLYRGLIETPTAAGDANTSNIPSGNAARVLALCATKLWGLEASQLDRTKQAAAGTRCDIARQTPADPNTIRHTFHDFWLNGVLRGDDDPFRIIETMETITGGQIVFRQGKLFLSPGQFIVAANAKETIEEHDLTRAPSIENNPDLFSRRNTVVGRLRACIQTPLTLHPVEMPATHNEILAAIDNATLEEDWGEIELLQDYFAAQQVMYNHAHSLERRQSGTITVEATTARQDYIAGDALVLNFPSHGIANKIFIIEQVTLVDDQAGGALLQFAVREQPSQDPFRIIPDASWDMVPHDAIRPRIDAGTLDPPVITNIVRDVRHVPARIAFDVEPVDPDLIGEWFLEIRMAATAAELASTGPFTAGQITSFIKPINEVRYELTGPKFFKARYTSRAVASEAETPAWPVSGWSDGSVPLLWNDDAAAVNPPSNDRFKKDPLTAEWRVGTRGWTVVTPSASGGDGSDIVYAIKDAPDWLAFNASTRNLSVATGQTLPAWDYANDGNNFYACTLTATAGDQEIDTDITIRLLRPLPQPGTGDLTVTILSNTHVQYRINEVAPAGPNAAFWVQINEFANDQLGALIREEYPREDGTIWDVDGLTPGLKYRLRLWNYDPYTRSWGPQRNFDWTMPDDPDLHFNEDGTTTILAIAGSNIIYNPGETPDTRTAVILPSAATEREIRGVTQPITYKAIDLPGTLEVDTATRTVTATGTFRTQPYPSTFQWKADDGGGTPIFKTILLDIQPQPPAPDDDPPLSWVLDQDHVQISIVKGTTTFVNAPIFLPEAETTLRDAVGRPRPITYTLIGAPSTIDVDPATREIAANAPLAPAHYAWTWQASVGTDVSPISIPIYPIVLDQAPATTLYWEPHYAQKQAIRGTQGGSALTPASPKLPEGFSRKGGANLVYEVKGTLPSFLGVNTETRAVYLVGATIPADAESGAFTWVLRDTDTGERLELTIYITIDSTTSGLTWDTTDKTTHIYLKQGEHANILDSAGNNVFNAAISGHAALPVLTGTDPTEYSWSGLPDYLTIAQVGNTLTIHPWSYRRPNDPASLVPADAVNGTLKLSGTRGGKTDTLDIPISIVQSDLIIGTGATRFSVERGGNTTTPVSVIVPTMTDRQGRSVVLTLSDPTPFGTPGHQHALLFIAFDPTTRRVTIRKDNINPSGLIPDDAISEQLVLSGRVPGQSSSSDIPIFMEVIEPAITWTGGRTVFTVDAQADAFTGSVPQLPLGHTNRDGATVTHSVDPTTPLPSYLRVDVATGLLSIHGDVPNTARDFKFLWRGNDGEKTEQRTITVRVVNTTPPPPPEEPEPETGTVSWLDTPDYTRVTEFDLDAQTGQLRPKSSLPRGRTTRQGRSVGYTAGAVPAWFIVNVLNQTMLVRGRIPSSAQDFSFSWTVSDGVQALTEEIVVTIVNRPSEEPTPQNLIGNWVGGTRLIKATIGTATLDPAAPVLPTNSTTRAGASISYRVARKPYWLNIDPTTRAVSLRHPPPVVPTDARTEDILWLATDGVSQKVIRIEVRVKAAAGKLSWSDDGALSIYATPGTANLHPNPAVLPSATTTNAGGTIQYEVEGLPDYLSVSLATRTVRVVPLYSGATPRVPSTFQPSQFVWRARDGVADPIEATIYIRRA